ncbi:hypothetical protein K380107A5_21900 [Holdemania massiliensis]|uniref:hypothetical protein n=1 Tax=Holdemania massiliensis TaxID=1468449 RepID=UPI003520033D
MYFISLVLGIIQLLLIGFILISEIKRKSPAVFLWATLIIMFGIPHLVTAIFEDMNYSSAVIAQASLFVIGFCIIYLLIRKKRTVNFVKLEENKFFLIHSSKIENTVFESMCFVIFLIAIIGYTLYFIRANGDILNTSWASVRSTEKSYVSFVGLAERIIFMFSGLSMFYFLTNRRVKSAVVLLLFAVMVLVTRNRVEVLPILIFFIVLYLLKIKKIKIKHIVIGIALAILVIYIVYGIRAFRWLGSLSNAFSSFSIEYINKTVLGFISSKDGELGLRQYFYYFISKNNDFVGFNRCYTYIRMLLVYIPSQFSLGLKPQSFDLYMGQAIGMASGGSMHPTLFGDCFGNLYWFGILLGGVWAAIANGIDTLINRQKFDFYKIMIFFLGSYSFVVVGRGSVYNGFEVLAWGMLFLWILKCLTPQLVNIRFTFGHRTLHAERHKGMNDEQE